MISRKQFMDSAPSWLQAAIKTRMRYKRIEWSRSSDEDDGRPDGRVETSRLCDAEAISSQLRDVDQHPDDDDLHVVMLDLDVPAMLVPSSQDGHHHLYINKILTWAECVKLLDVLVELRIVEEGYAKASKERKATFLRLPWIKKGSERKDAHRSVEEWLNDDEPLVPAPSAPSAELPF